MTRLSSYKMNTVTRVQMQDKGVSISHTTDTFVKGMLLNILSPAFGKLLVRLGFFSLV